MKKITLENLGIWIVAATILGTVVGFLMGDTAQIFAPLGDIFIKLIKMVVVPLIFFSIISGSASLNKTGAAGKVGLFTVVYYMATTCVAIIIGILLAVIFKPGLGLSGNINQMFAEAVYTEEQSSIAGFWAIIKGFIPSNPFESLSTGNILQIIFFAVFSGIGISKLPGEKEKTLLHIVDSINGMMIWMIKKILIIAPIGVFGLMAASIGNFGADVLVLVLKLLAVYTAGLLIHTFGFLAVIVNFLSEIRYFRFLRRIYPAQVFAFSSASSMATLPYTTECCEDMGVKKSINSFVLPLGATVNMDGNALYYALATVFFAQMFGVDLNLTAYLAIMFTAAIGAVGQAGVPGPSLLLVAVVTAAGVPVAAVPLLFGVDRIFDMLRTAVNITGDASCAVIANRYFGKGIVEEH